jgi:hybrid cluster-associated redox disulfide protein
MIMQQPTLSSRSLVGDVLAETPPLADLFLAMRLDCMGCSMSKFCTLEEVSRQYGLELEAFLRTIQTLRDARGVVVSPGEAQ